MHKITLILAFIALSQLTGCVAHRYHSEAPNRTYSGYSNSYPVPYPEQYTSQNQYQNQYQGQSEMAQIISIRTIGAAPQSHGGGAVLGALIGGIIGNQLGRSDGHGSRHDYRRGDRHGYGHHYGRRHTDDGARAAATLGGAIIGGVIGNEVERGSAEPRRRTEVALRLANGQTQTIILDHPGQFRVGDQVQLSYQSGRWVIY